MLYKWIGGSEGYFGTFFLGMIEFTAILQFLCPGGLERAVRQRRDAPRRADLRVHEAHRATDHLVIPQAFPER